VPVLLVGVAGPDDGSDGGREDDALHGVRLRARLQHVVRRANLLLHRQLIALRLVVGRVEHAEDAGAPADGVGDGVVVEGVGPEHLEAVPVRVAGAARQVLLAQRGRRRLRAAAPAGEDGSRHPRAA